MAQDIYPILLSRLQRKPKKRDLYAEATETNVEKFIGTADTADKLQENDKFADKQDFAEKFAEKFSQKFVDKFTEKKLEDMDEDKFADNTNKKYWNWRMLFQQPTLLFFIKCFSKQQQQKQQNKCGDSWTFEDGLLIMGMGYLMGYLFNSVLLMSVIIAIMIIARSVIKRRSITVNSIKQDPLPDNDTLANSETPPPSYFCCNYNYNSSITSTLTNPPPVIHLSEIWPLARQQQQQQQQQQQNECGSLWTFRDGYIIMVMGTLFLCVMLLVWVIMAIMAIRRLINSRQDSLLPNNDILVSFSLLPNNDTLVSSETSPPPPEMPPPSYFELDEKPPPSYFELEIDDQNFCDYNSITSTLMTPPLGTAV
ncbi:hypothetical protein Hamer_G026848 [Homarus americanus]|uniref:Uncharacterized protein n=1 Tax=Homarus americanus TaxID=6706 RepID=A0A8J5JGG8_HOMAM|nr:hypothetical protein Hamer_G026848 [Homarus americanus]